VVRVKLGDFGLALNMNPSVTHMTLPGHVGTPLTTAPEIFTERKTSANSDVFAWGMSMSMVVNQALGPRGQPASQVGDALTVHAVCERA
jgi:serine/threonine protein kinase